MTSQEAVGEQVQAVHDAIAELYASGDVIHYTEDANRAAHDGLDALVAALVAERDATQKEIEQLRDRAVCSGCGQDVNEGGACETRGCYRGEIIPSSDLPSAFLEALRDANNIADEWQDELQQAVAERDTWKEKHRNSETDWRKEVLKREQAVAERDRYRDALELVDSPYPLDVFPERTDEQRDAIFAAMREVDQYATEWFYAHVARERGRVARAALAVSTP